jgi:predicted ATPase/DNA-binding CsgD family transcriptional regulator/Tfp pilus assembly protein PilF
MSPSNNLTPQATRFIGREQLLEVICSRVLGEEGRLLTLTGPGGTGKSRLALQAAAALLSHFPDGVFVVSLGPLSSPHLVPATIAADLGIPERAGSSILEVVSQELREKKMLLVLDNFEHVSAAARSVAKLLAVCSGLRVMVTSRAVLHLYGEQIVAIPPLALPDRRPILTAKYALQFESVRLFAERASAARLDFTLNDSNAPAAAEICRRLDGLPLAIELSAARLRALPLTALLDRMHRRLPLLTGGPQDLPARQRTLRDTLDWSYELLGQNERRLFERLGVFRGCTLDAIEAVCCTPTDQSAGTSLVVSSLNIDVVEGVTSLVDNSLLHLEPTIDGKPWYSMLETVREYALERLDDRGEADAVHRRHAYHYLRLAESADPELIGQQQSTWFSQLEQEHNNFRAALNWCQERRYAEVALRLATALWWFWAVHGHASEGREHLSSLLDQFRPAASARRPAAARARALEAAGNLATFQGDYTSGRVLHEGALQLFRDLDDLPGVEGTLHALALVASRQGDNDTARRLLQDALDLARTRGDRLGIGHALYNLANVLHEQGQYDTARSLLEESLVLKREAGLQRDVGLALLTLGAIAMDQRDHAGARTCYEESLAGCREAGDQRAAALSLANLGAVDTADGDYTSAQRHLTESATIHQQLGDLAGVAFVLERFVALAAAQHLYPRAICLAAAAEALRKAIGAPLSPIALGRLDRGLATARRVLGQEAAGAAHAAGRELPPADAIAYALDTREPPPHGEQRSAILTPREQEVASLIARGFTNRQIAAELVITEGTAASHVVHILGKLACGSRAQVAAWVTEHNLVGADHQSVTKYQSQPRPVAERR